MTCISVGVPVALTIVAIIIVIMVPLVLKYHHHSKVLTGSQYGLTDNMIDMTDMSYMTDITDMTDMTDMPYVTNMTHTADTTDMINITNMANLTHITNMTNTEFSNTLANFGVKVFSELSQSHSDKNILFSPFSLQACLAMVRMGVQGQTADEMDATLNFTNKSLESVAGNYQSLLAKYENSSILSVANKIYVMQNYEINDEFNETLSKKFFASAEAIDFSRNEEAARTMNNWVETKTQKSIQNLVSPGILSADTRVLVLSAIHFKGEWATTFPITSTSEQDFYIDDQNKTAKVQMMFKKSLCHYNTFPELDATAVRLSYKDSDLSMLIFLPNSRSGLAAMEEKLKEIQLGTITKEMRARTSVKVYLPKFKAEFEVELKDVLIKLGMKRMFTSGDFGKMLKTPEPMQVSNVIHKAFIDVNEKGTEAAAATGIAVVTRDGGGLQSTVFRADHPFYYVITNADNVRLFEGTFIGL